MPVLEVEAQSFAAQMSRKSVAVVLDPDVAEVFRDGKPVNGVLRASDNNAGRSLTITQLRRG